MQRKQKVYYLLEAHDLGLHFGTSKQKNEITPNSPKFLRFSPFDRSYECLARWKESWDGTELAKQIYGSCDMNPWIHKSRCSMSDQHSRLVSGSSIQSGGGPLPLYARRSMDTKEASSELKTSLYILHRYSFSFDVVVPFLLWQKVSSTLWLKEGKLYLGQ